MCIDLLSNKQAHLHKCIKLFKIKINNDNQHTAQETCQNMQLTARTVLSFSYLEVLHQDGDDDIDENELCHEDEDNKKHRSDKWTDAAVANAIVTRVAVIAQCVLPNDKE